MDFCRECPNLQRHRNSQLQFLPLGLAYNSGSVVFSTVWLHFARFACISTRSPSTPTPTTPSHWTVQYASLRALQL